MTKEWIMCEIDCIKEFLGQAISGYQYDMSWIRPQSLTKKERQEKFKMAGYILDRLITDLEKKVGV